MFVGFFVSDGRCYRDIYPTYAKLYLLEYDAIRYPSSFAAMLHKRTILYFSYLYR